MNSWKLDKEIKKSVVKLIERRKESSGSGTAGDVKMAEKSRKDLLGKYHCPRHCGRVQELFLCRQTDHIQFADVDNGSSSDAPTVAGKGT